MYLAVINDPYSEDSEKIFELENKDYLKKIRTLSKQFELTYLEKIDKKDLKELEAIKDYIEEQYETLDYINNKVPRVDIKSIPLCLDSKPVKPRPAEIKQLPQPLKRSNIRYNQKMSFMTKLFMSKIEKHYREMNNLYIEDNEDWLAEYEAVLTFNEQSKSINSNKHNQYLDQMKKYKAIKSKKTEVLNAWDSKISMQDTKSIEDYLVYLLSHIHFPMKPFNHDIKCKVDKNTLRIDVRVPLVDDLLDVKNIRYIKSHDEIRITHYTQSELNKFYQQFIMKYIALISALIKENIQYFPFESFVINGVTKGKLKINNITIISTKTSSNELFDGGKDKEIAEWMEKTDALIGKKLVNRTALKKVY